MSMTDFDFEFQTDLSYLSQKDRDKAEKRLRELGDGRKDIVGAAVSVRKMEGNQDVSRQHQARVVVYMKPDNKAAREKHKTAEQALKNAVDAVIRQVREHWDKMRTMQRQNRG
jgi:ribosome-associated translation inhibitor RaiA